jgi:hypothetical protein
MVAVHDRPREAELDPHRLRQDRQRARPRTHTRLFTLTAVAAAVTVVNQYDELFETTLAATPFPLVGLAEHPPRLPATTPATTAAVASRRREIGYALIGHAHAPGPGRDRCAAHARPGRRPLALMVGIHP